MLCKLSTFNPVSLNLDGSMRPVASIKPNLPKNKLFTIRIAEKGIEKITEKQNEKKNILVEALMKKKGKKQMIIIELKK